MKITQEQFNKAKETFSKRSLNNSEKNLILSNIYSEVTKQKGVIVSPFGSYFAFLRQKAFVVVVAIAVLISGVSYASAQSLPGDSLYKIKVNLLEPTSLAFAFGEDSKNEYKISLLRERVDELKELKKRGEINEKSKNDSYRAINRNIKAIKNSAIFNKEGKNTYVSEQIRNYNNLMNPKLKLESDIEINHSEEKESQTEYQTEYQTEQSERNIIENEGVDSNFLKRVEDVSIDKEGGLNVEEKIKVDLIDKNNNLPLNNSRGVLNVEIKKPEL